MKKYQIIVVDPPWKIQKIKKKLRPNQINMDYPMMSLEEIKALSIHKIADEKCVLFLWVIDKYLFNTKEILESWGFKYHLTMAWDKTNGQAIFGFQRQTEFIVVGFRGIQDIFPKRKVIRTSFTAKSPYHSAKPNEFYQMLDVLEGDRIDIFARYGRDNLFGKKWDVMGNEINGKNIQNILEELSP